MELHIQLHGEPVRLLAERALFRESNATLYVADLHIGKSSTFRAERIAVPHGTTAATLDRLTLAIRATSARRLLLLGDFFHSRIGRHPDTMNQLGRWRELHRGVAIQLVRGNHDRHAGDPDVELDILCHDAPYDDAGWSLRHHPGSSRDPFWLAGHIHPAVALVGTGRQSLFLPCFHVTPGGVVLPSFGEFTGKGEVVPVAGDRIFVVAGDEVVAV